jgi:histidinol-phosphate aminotransferase
MPYQPGKPIEELERELGISNIVKLASNENAYGPCPGVLESLAAIPELLRYPDGNGFNLKKALAAFHNVAVEQITLGNGSNDILDMVVRAFVTDRQQTIYSQHAFAIYPIVTQAVGATAIEVPALNWGHDLPAMARAVNEQTRVIFIANPNNPTGTWLDSNALDTFMQAVPEDVIVLLDQAYFEYVHEPEYPDCIRWIERYPNLIATRTFSKAYGLAALRVGYSISHADAADLLNRVRQPFNVNSIALYMAEIALADQSHIQACVRFNDTGLRQLSEGLDSMGIHYIPTVANFLCIDLQQPARDIYEKLLREGVIVRPVAGYGMPNHLRVTVGLQEENEIFLSALAKVLAR